MAKQKGAVPDAEDVFIAGVAFARAAEQIKEGFAGPLRTAGKKTGFELKPKDGTPFNLVLPFGVNNAFAVELLLKCLHVIDLGTHPTGHNLGALFDALPLATRLRAEKHFDELQGQRTGEKLRELLHDNRGSFADLRYAYEDPNKARYSLGMAHLALIKSIVEVRPQWECHAHPYKQPS